MIIKIERYWIIFINDTLMFDILVESRSDHLA